MSDIYDYVPNFENSEYILRFAEGNIVEKERKIMKNLLFETERLILRDYRENDFEAYYRLKSDSGTMYYLQDRVTTGCLAENKGSEKVMLKGDMIKEAEHKDYEWHDGNMKTRLEYRLLRSEWRQNEHSGTV